MFSSTLIKVVVSYRHYNITDVFFSLNTALEKDID